MPEETRDLDNSLKFDDFLHLPDSHQGPLDEVVTAIIRYHSLSDRRDVREGLKRATSAILANLVKASETGEGVYLAIPLSQSAYTITRYNNPDISYRNVHRTVGYLCREGGEVEKYQGFIDRDTGISRSTRIIFKEEEGHPPREQENTDRPTDPIGPPSPSSNHQPFVTSSTLDIPLSLLPPSFPREVIRLRDENRREMEYEDTDQVVSMRREVKLWNEYAVRQWVDIFLPHSDFQTVMQQASSGSGSGSATRPRVLDLTRRTLYRIFNDGSWDLGGRLYGGWWQEVPSWSRKFITINGQPTKEMDFPNMQIALLYAREGLALDQDAYELEGVDREYRDLIKRIMLQLLNAQEGQGVRNPSASELPPGWSFEDLQQALRDKHEPISSYFRTGIGLSLQKEDADIAMAIITDLGQRDILALPIHDSFIVPFGYASTLETAMRDAYREHTGQDIGITEGDMLFGLYREDDDEPDDEYWNYDTEPHWVQRMENAADSPEYAHYRRRLFAFRDTQSQEWQTRYSGRPTSW